MRVKRYTVSQRIFHAINIVSILGLIVSGLFIYSPSLLNNLHIPTSTWFTWHRWFVAIFLVTTIFHIIYDSLVLDRFPYMWFGEVEWQKIRIIVKNFLGFTTKYPKYDKYHPGQILYHWFITLNLIALTLTGFVLWEPFRFMVPFQLFGLGWDFIHFNRTLHALFTATLIALIIGHVYFGLILKKNWPESKSILIGTIPMDHYLKYHEMPLETEIVPAKIVEEEVSESLRI